MPRSLRSKLILAFAAVIFICLFSAGTGFVIFFRNHETEQEREKVGRLAQPLALRVTYLEWLGLMPEQMRPALDDYAASLDVPRREASLKGDPLILRAKEFDLLATFLQNEGLVMDRERLIQRVWGHDFYGDSRTIDVHVAWLRDKLGGSNVQIQTVWGIGYKLVVNADVEKPAK
jgi:DNA-binding response OmpR family regulator